MRHPGPFLWHTLLALGALPSLPARSQEDLDREDSARRERVRADLVACDIDPEEVLVSTGEARFLEVGRQVVALSNYHWQTVGERKPLADLLQLVAELKGAHRRLQAPVIHWSGMGKDVPGGVRSGKTLGFAAAYIREAVGREAHRAQVAPVLAAARMPFADAYERTAEVKRDRQAQREAKRVRKAAKSRRGW